MKKVLKWIGIVLAGLLGLLVVAAVVFYALGSAKLNKTREIQAEAIAIPTGEAALARGEILAGVASCTVCHGRDLSGDVEIDDATIGTVYASNISGLGQTYSDADFIRAIRHGVDRDGRQLLLMPANIFISHLSAEDLGALIAYLKTVPPVENNLPEPQLTLIGRILVGTGLLGDALAAEVIDHSQPIPPMPEIGANVEYGAYLTGFCASCHGEDLDGQPAEPEFGVPARPNLTPGGELGNWSKADFLKTMRTGVTPQGRELDPEFMRRDAFAKMTEDELGAVWMYLQSLPSRESAS
jgi:cytochrome c553